jgi:hypothetical protein
MSMAAQSVRALIGTAEPEAAAINALIVEYDAAESRAAVAEGQVVDIKTKIGHLLVAQKEALGYGVFGRWRDGNINKSPRWCQEAMELASGKKTQQEHNDNKNRAYARNSKTEAEDEDAPTCQVYQLPTMEIPENVKFIIEALSRLTSGHERSLVLHWIRAQWSDDLF